MAAVGWSPIPLSPMASLVSRGSSFSPSECERRLREEEHVSRSTPEGSSKQRVGSVPVPVLVRIAQVVIRYSRASRFSQSPVFDVFRGPVHHSVDASGLFGPKAIQQLVGFPLLSFHVCTLAVFVVPEIALLGISLCQEAGFRGGRGVRSKQLAIGARRKRTGSIEERRR